MSDRLAQVRDLTIALFCFSAAAAPAAASCPETGQWLWEDGEVRSTSATLERIPDGAIVLLGERHGQADDHRWQLQVASALIGRNDAVTIGYEMFPRQSQSTLDDWVSGHLGEDDFLKQSDWDSHWGMGLEHYMPLFQLNRMNAVPMRALNFDRDLIRRIGADGWDGVSSEDRYGVSPPADPPEAYSEHLKEVYQRHPGGDNGNEQGFERFQRSQLAWDRAMAEALDEASQGEGIVIGIVGRGHVRHGHGIPHQLADLGHERVITLLPDTEEEICEQQDELPATAMFALPPEAED